MAKDLNVCTFIGRATRDAELSYASSGLAIGKFSLAVNGWKDGEVSFFNFVLFGKLAESVTKYITKGKQLSVSGEAKQNKWADRDTGKMRYAIEFSVSTLQLLGGGQQRPEPSKEMFKTDTAEDAKFSEDIPF